MLHSLLLTPPAGDLFPSGTTTPLLVVAGVCSKWGLELYWLLALPGLTPSCIRLKHRELITAMLCKLT